MTERPVPSVHKLLADLHAYRLKTRYRRTDEFHDVVKLEWSSERSFGYDGAAAYADLIRLVHDQVGEDIDSYRARVAA